MPIDNDLFAVESKLVGVYESASITGITATKYPNARFTTPTNAPWARLFLTPANSQINTDASGCYEINQGIFNISVFWPKGSGTKAALNAAHEIKELYENAALDDVIIRSVVVSPTNEPESSTWYGVNINITYQYEGYRS